MTQQFITDKLNEAREYMNKVEQIGEVAYNMCDGILTNLKTLIHDEVLWKKINDKEEKTYREFSKRSEEAKLKLKDVDPLLQWNDGLRYYMNLRQWKSTEMITFWDKLSKEHDL